MTSAPVPQPAPGPIPSPAPPTPDPYAVKFPEPRPNATKAQIEDYGTTLQARNTLVSAADRASQLVAQAGGDPRKLLAGPIASELDIVIGDLVVGMGQKSLAGTMQPSDLITFGKLVGDPTSLQNYIQELGGIRQFAAKLEAIKGSAQRALISRAVEAGQDKVVVRIEGRDKTVPVFSQDTPESKRKAKSLPKGSYFVDAFGNLRGPTPGPGQ